MITLLAPIILIGIMTVPAVIAFMTATSDESTVVVVDDTEVLLDRLRGFSDESINFVTTDLPVDSLRTAVRAGTYDGYVTLPATLLDGEGAATYYSAKGSGLSGQGRLRNIISKAVEQERLDREQAPPKVVEIVKSSVSVRMVTLTDEGEEADGSAAYFAVGIIMGMFIYVTVLIYGALVMQGVIEEKNNRVVEVMVSSVRPFQLLMGKVLGIGAMGLVQMAAWAGILFGLTLAAGGIFAAFIDPSQFNLPADASQEAMLEAANISIPSLPPGLFIWFVLFFLGGYLLFASLYAAVGSAVEQPQDAQALSVPLTMVVILPMLFLSDVLESPNSPLSMTLSFIPFFSPILMIVRIAVTDVPFWQVALSYLLLIGGFVGSIWVSSRIYRVGILMYGKKPSLKDLARWFRYA